MALKEPLEPNGHQFQFLQDLGFGDGDDRPCADVLQFTLHEHDGWIRGQTGMVEEDAVDVPRRQGFKVDVVPDATKGGKFDGVHRESVGEVGRTILDLRRFLVVAFTTPRRVGGEPFALDRVTPSGERDERYVASFCGRSGNLEQVVHIIPRLEFIPVLHDEPVEGAVAQLFVEGDRRRPDVRRAGNIGTPPRRSTVWAR